MFSRGIRGDWDGEETRTGSRAFRNGRASQCSRGSKLERQQKNGRPTAVPTSLRPYLVRAGLFTTVTMGRSSGSRIGRTSTPSPNGFWSGLGSVRPRLQRRDRDGFAPSSLFSPPIVDWSRHPLRPVKVSCASDRINRTAVLAITVQRPHRTKCRRMAASLRQIDRF
jgi:hypothetical protein